MVRQNTAQLLIRHYVFHGPGNFIARGFHVLPLLTRKLRRTHMGTFYDVLRHVPAAERRTLLLSVALNPVWLRAVKELQLKHRAHAIELTIISRNCADVVREWVQLHKEELASANIHVVTLIANKPMNDLNDEFVREYDDFRHIDHAGFGQLHMQDKLKFVDKHTVYLGDAEEELMRGIVQEFIGV